MGIFQGCVQDHLKSQIHALQDQCPENQKRSQYPQIKYGTIRSYFDSGRAIQVVFFWQGLAFARGNSCSGY